jgi:hypothetical protein
MRVHVHVTRVPISQVPTEVGNSRLLPFIGVSSPCVRDRRAKVSSSAWIAMQTWTKSLNTIPSTRALMLRCFHCHQGRS